MVFAFQMRGEEFQVAECSGYEPALKKFQFSTLTLGKSFNLLMPLCPHM